MRTSEDLGPAQSLAQSGHLEWVEPVSPAPSPSCPCLGVNHLESDWESSLSPPVCRTAETQPQGNPFLCMDLTYISLLLQEFGFPENKVLKVRTVSRVPLYGLRAGGTASSLPTMPTLPIPLCFQADSENQQC